MIKIKIFFASDYIPNYFPTWGGAEQACVRLVTLLQQRGHAVSVITTITDKLIAEVFNHISLKVIEDYLPVSAKKPIRFFKSTLVPYDALCHILSRKLFKNASPDILHLHNFSSLSFSLLLSAKKYHIPTMMSVYDFWFICPEGFCWFLLDYLSYSGKPCKTYHGRYCIRCLSKYIPLTIFQKSTLLGLLPFRKKIFDYFLNLLDGFIVLSEDNGRILRQYGIPSHKIHVVHIPLITEDIENSNLQSPEIEEYSILYTGWTHPRKGLKVIVEAMCYIVKSFPQAKLYVLGGSYDPRYEEVISKIVNKNNLEKNVYLLGKKPHSIVQQHIRKAHVIAIPEQWETIAPNALTEAMVFGKAIVASNMGSHLDIIKHGENGLLAEFNQPASYAEKIIQIFQNKIDIVKLQNKARETGQRLFSGEKVYEELLSAYQAASPVFRTISVQ